MADRDSPLNRQKSIKWFLSRIEDVKSGVPFQIETLCSHKIKIHQAYKLENFSAVRQERISAERIIRNLKQLQIEINSLREQVVESDRDKFDKSVRPSCERITDALKSFSDFFDKLPLDRHAMKPWNSSQSMEPNNDESRSADDSRQNQILLQIEDDRWQLQNQLEVAEATEKLEQDVQTVNEIIRDLAGIINADREKVEHIEINVENSHAQVVAAERQLARVNAKLKYGLYPLIGAVAGSIVGGPIGLVAGVKVGTIVAVTGGAIGFSSGKVLKIKQQRASENILKKLDEQSTVACEKSN